MSTDGLLSSGGLGYRPGSVRDAAEIIETLTDDEDQWRTRQEVSYSFVRSRDVDSPQVQHEFRSILTGSPSQVKESMKTDVRP